MKNYTYAQSRANENAYKSYKEIVASEAHKKGIEARVVEFAAKICKRYGLPERMKGNLVSLINYDYENVELLPNKIENLLNLLSSYGYGVKTLENNFPLLKHSSSDLLNALSIASQYGFDEEILTHYTFYSASSANEVYSLTEELKSKGIEPNYEEVEKLYISKNNAGEIKKLNEAHPMNQVKVRVYRTLYARKINELNNKQVLTRTK